MAIPIPAKVALRYVRRVLKGFDMFCNVLTGGNVGETISARAGRLQAKGVFGACVLCRLLDLIERDHCINALARETSQGNPR